MIGSIERLQQTDQLARDILKLSRNTLLINLRFLDAALCQFVPSPMETMETLATDGQYLYYNVWHVLRSYRKAREIPVRDYLHVAFHCIFHHPFVSLGVVGPVWDLACDIAVEHAITELAVRSATCPREAEQTGVLTGLKRQLNLLTAEKIYRHYLNQELSGEEIELLRMAFIADDHALWYEHSDCGDGEDGTAGDKMPAPDNPDGTDGQPHQKQGEEGGEDSGDCVGEGPPDDGGGGGEQGPRSEPAPGGDHPPRMSRNELEPLWNEISERIQVDLETSSRQWGEAAGGLLQELKAVNRETYDYSDFLRSFAVLGEQVQINDDEFDYVFYNYGFRLYRNMPLVEPLEYKEVRCVREFVVAIDTSASVAGDLVQRFVTKTWNILKQTESFFTRINLHIIQCGAAIEEDAKITTQEEIDAYMETMTLRGFSGTDFRPVFSHVDELIRQREFANLKGLIYFTDGYGPFPEYPPEYRSAFVFVGDGIGTPEVPPWAIKLVLSQEDI